MNPILRTYLEHIDRLIDEIDAQVGSLEERYVREHDRAERLRTQYWNRGKTLSVLQDTADTVEQLKEENAQFKRAQSELEQRLTHVLGYAKALGAELRT